MNKMFSGYAWVLIMTVFAIYGCNDKPEYSGPEGGNTLADFDWKTTKTVPVNIESESGKGVAVYVYNGNKIVATGYTPFREQITVPTTCDELMVTIAPLAEGAQLPLKNTKADTKAIYTIVCGDGTTVVVPALIDLHEYLYTQWAAVKHYGWDYYVGWWNTAGGPQGQSSITLYLDRPPVYDEQGNAEIYHTCLWDGCKDEQEDQDLTFTDEGTYIFEDLFPSMGDYDMNDFVVEKSAVNTVSKDNRIIKSEITCKVMAAGGSADIAMAFFMPSVPASAIEKVEMFRINAEGNEEPYTCENTTGLFNLSVQGVENGSSAQAVIPVFDKVASVINKTVEGMYFNTQADGGKGDPAVIKIYITFKASSSVSISQFNTDLFIMPRHTEDALTDWRGREIHIVDAPFTSLMNQALFNTEDDASDLVKGKYFRARDGFVWGLYIPVSGFRHPLEKTNLLEAYPSFHAWINSNGNKDKNWYTRPVKHKVWTW